MPKKLVLLLVMIGLLGLPASLVAQEPPLLEPGVMVEASLNEVDEVDVYQYAGVTGERVTLTMVAEPGSGLDPVLELYDPFGFLVAKNDDINQAGGIRDAGFSLFLPFDGEYEIVARSFAGASSGGYTLFLTSQAPPPPVSLGSVRLDEVISGELQAGTDVWDFVPVEDGVFEISLTSETFDPLLEITDITGLSLALDDDSGEGVNALIAGVPLSANEVYQIRVQSFNGEGSGPYALLVRQVGALPTSDAPGTLQLGETVSGILLAGEQLTFIFEGNAGERVSILTEGDFDAYLEIRDRFEDIIAEDDDSGPDFMPQIEGLELPEDGSYSIVLRGFNEMSTGNFSLTLLQVEAAASVAPEAVPLNLGQSQESTLVAGQVSRFTFQGEAGTAIQIEVLADLDTVMELYGPAGEFLVGDDDSGGAFNPLIENFTLPRNRRIPDRYFRLFFGCTRAVYHHPVRSRRSPVRKPGLWRNRARGAGTGWPGALCVRGQHRPVDFCQRGEQL
ncbi:MAG: hypothetical protein HC915_13670 [Anaerolineae bacterium]|nr:hypothetical protein [Anaerolineae bacterium]